MPKFHHFTTLLFTKSNQVIRWFLTRGKTRASGEINYYLHGKVENERKWLLQVHTLFRTANLKTLHLCLANSILLFFNHKRIALLLPTATWFKFANWHAYTTIILRTACLISFSHFFSNIKLFYKGEVTGHPVLLTSCTTDFHGCKQST